MPVLSLVLRTAQLIRDAVRMMMQISYHRLCRVHRPQGADCMICSGGLDRVPRDEGWESRVSQ